MNADRDRVTVAEGALLAAMKAGGTVADFVNALDAGGHLQTPGEVRDLTNRVARSRTAWKSARGRARSTGSAADRYAARARDLQHALQDMVGAQLALQMQRDAALRRLAELDLSPSCDRCRCTDDHACDGGCVWVPNPYGLDVCSACLTLEGRCTTPLCGDIEKPCMLGWILVDVAGSEVPARFHCSPWCAALAIQRIGMQMADDDQAEAAAPEKDTRDPWSLKGESTPALVIDRFDGADPESTPDDDEVLRIGAVTQDGRPVTLVLDAETRARVASWLGRPLRAYLPRYEHDPAPLGWYGTEAGARAHCEAEMLVGHPGEDPPTPDWITDEEDGVAELVATNGKAEQATGYCVITVDLPAAYDAGADW